MEPSPLLARAIRRGLEEEGMTLRIAQDLAQAGRLAEAQPFDVIVLDVPVQIEVATLQHWRRCDIDAPVLFLTLPGSRPDRFGQLGLGPASAVTKPFHFADLLDRVHRLAERHMAAPSEYTVAASAFQGV
jgi:DNA-binding response OmpR family regulator